MARAKRRCGGPGAVPRAVPRGGGVSHALWVSRPVVTRGDPPQGSSPAWSPAGGPRPPPCGQPAGQGGCGSHDRSARRRCHRVGGHDCWRGRSTHVPSNRLSGCKETGRRCSSASVAPRAASGPTSGTVGHTSPRPRARCSRGQGRPSGGPAECGSPLRGHDWRGTTWGPGFLSCFPAAGESDLRAKGSPPPPRQRPPAGVCS